MKLQKNIIILVTFSLSLSLVLLRLCSLPHSKDFPSELLGMNQAVTKSLAIVVRLYTVVYMVWVYVSLCVQYAHAVICSAVGFGITILQKISCNKTHYALNKYVWKARSIRTDGTNEWCLHQITHLVDLFAQTIKH